MRNRLVVFLLVGIGLVFGLLVARQIVLSRSLPRDEFADHKLRLLTYTTFIHAGGPGSEILNRFEKDNHCKVEVIATADAGLLLERLKLGQAGSQPFDAVLGLDQLMLANARRDFKWREVKEDRTAWSPEPAALSDANFAAFDWSPMSFVYKEGASGELPKSFDDLTSSGFAKAFALEDPHASTPGLEFYGWVRALKGEHAREWLEKFKPSVHSVSPSWSFAYGLFKRGQARFVFSYLTSLAYHWGEEKDRSYKILALPEGHPVQVEFVAVPDGCRECDLAVKLVETLHSDWAQTLIMQKNYMLPVLPALTAGTVYSELPKLKTLSGAAPAALDLKEWDEVFGH